MVNTEETTVDTEIETTETTTDNVDIESLQSELADEKNKNKDLWDKIYKLKKERKVTNTEKSDTWFWKDDMEAMLNERDFYKTNPTMVEHKEDIDKFTSKGYSLKHAMDAVVEDNPDIAARQNTQNSNFTAWALDLQKTEFTKDELWNMNQSEYNKTMALIESWKAVKV